MSFSLTTFINELALAWQKLAIYQQGHPARNEAVGRAHAVLVGLIAPTGSLALGVSREALIGPDEKLSTQSATRLATALYLLEVAVLRFEEGVEVEELEHLLSLLPRGNTFTHGGPLSDSLTRLGVRHVRVESVDFTELMATDSLEDTGADGQDASLWDRILQRLLNDERLAAVGSVLEEAEGGSFAGVLSVVNSLLEKYGASEAESHRPGDSVSSAEVLGVLAGVVGEATSEQLMTTEDADAQRSTVRHITELLAAMPEGMREGVLDAAVRQLATRDDAGPAFDTLSGAVSAAQMVGSLRRLRDEKVQFAPRMVSLVESLVVDAAPAFAQAATSRNPDELAAALKEIFADDDIDRFGPNSTLDDRLFISLRKNIPIHARFADLDPYLDTIVEDRIHTDLTTMLIDLLQRPYMDAQNVTWVIARQQEVFRTLLASGNFDEATRIVESLRDLAASPEKSPAVREAAELCIEGLRSADTLDGIVDALSEQKASASPAVHRLINVLGSTSVRQLLNVLGEESDLGRRRNIFNLLTSLGPAVVPSAIGLLGDSRWYMTRNILNLLRKIGVGITPTVLRTGLEHTDSRVRIQAVKCIPSLDGELTPDLARKLLKDPDPKVTELALSTFGSARIRAAIGPMVELLSKPDPLARQRNIRLGALHALGQIGDPTVLPRISQFFRSVFGLVSADERHAAFETLGLYPEEARRPLVKKGRFAPDKKIRQICRRLEADDKTSAER